MLIIIYDDNGNEQIKNQIYDIMIKLNCKCMISLFDNIKTVRSVLLHLKDDDEFIYIDMNNINTFNVKNLQFENKEFHIVRTSLFIHPTFKVILENGKPEPQGFFMYYNYLRRYVKIKKLKNFIIEFNTIENKKDCYDEYFSGNGIVFDEQNKNKNINIIKYKIKVHEESVHKRHDPYILDPVIIYCIDNKCEMIDKFEDIYYTTENFFRPHNKFLIQQYVENNKFKIGIHLRSLCHFKIKQDFDSYIDSYIECINKIKIKENNKKEILLVIVGDNNQLIDLFINKIKDDFEYFKSEGSRTNNITNDWWINDLNKSYIYYLSMVDATLLSDCDYIIGGKGNYINYVKSINDSVLSNLENKFIIPDILVKCEIF